MPNSGPIPTVVISRPGVMQQALRASLALCPRILVVASASDGPTALDQIGLLEPSLVVIDSHLRTDEIAEVLAALGTRGRRPRCLVLVQSSQDERAMLAAGADAVLWRDSSGYEMQTLLTKLAQM
ncbi:MAG: hypothetical protein U0768_16790 [Anaerolineae bacterium]